MPAIVDQEGRGGKHFGVRVGPRYDMYLGRNTGKFYSQDEQRRVATEEWLYSAEGQTSDDGGKHTFPHLRAAKRNTPLTLHQRMDNRTLLAHD